MTKEKGLVILHVDGLGYHYLQKALKQGRMPFVQQLIEREGYEPLCWRCGIPSTTPYVQAGLIFGDNREIPSFRWWDKEANRLIVFGGLSSFKYVSDKYFRGTEPLLANGAAIAICYPGEAVETYRLSYRHRERARNDTFPTRHPTRRFSARHILASWLINPIHIVDLFRMSGLQLWKTARKYWTAKARGWRTAGKYVITNVLEEVFLHQMTRYATVVAMREDYPIIYSAFYSYDGMAHAFGPEADYSFRSLRHIDRTIQRIARQSKRFERDYELLILSDHGQTESVPFAEKYGQPFGHLVSAWLPACEVEEFDGRKFPPTSAANDHVVLTYSGGLAHMYFKDMPGRLERTTLDARFPGLLEKVAHTPGIGFVMARDGASDVLITREGEMRIGERGELADGVARFLASFDEPAILARQLHKLNSFERSGDLIIFGAYEGRRQVIFEWQVGGHGSVGGEQLFPFILAKREWGIDTSCVIEASDLYPQLRHLRDRLIRAPQPLPVPGEVVPVPA